jgi:hypothetical protein
MRNDLRLSLAGLLLCLASFCANAIAADCEPLLVPDFALPWRDTTLDLAYLATINADNFPKHRSNAIPKLSHAGIPLPIAGDLLLHAATFDDFATLRAQHYTERHFDYPLPDLAGYFQRVLPTERFDAFLSCVGASGLAAHITKADHDLVAIELSWHAPKDEPAQVVLGKLAVSGGTLLGTAPTLLPATLLLVRNLDVDLRVAVAVNGKQETVFVPRYVSADQQFDAERGACTSAPKVVRALYRQLLEREPTVNALATNLSNGTNSVRQLAERLVLGGEYERRFAKGKSTHEVLLGLYRRVLARDADEAGLATNEKRLGKASFTTIAMTFFENAEYARRFGDWSVPGTAAVAYCPGK